MDLSDLHGNNVENTEEGIDDSLESVNLIHPPHSIHPPRIQDTVVEDPHFAEEYSAESETGESESENTDLESDLPDLENDPLQSPRIRGVLLSPPHIPVNTRPERECWVCYLSESETPDSEFVRPCRCDGSVGFVHQDCVKRWVEEKQKSDIDMEVECPQCQTKYRFVFPKLKTPFKLMILAEQIINSGVTLFTIGGVIYGIHLVTVFYSRNVLKCLTVDKYDILGDGECRTLEPFRTILTDNIRTFINDIDLNWSFPILPTINYQLKEFLFKFGSYFFFLDFFTIPWMEQFKDTFLSLSIPWILYTFRKINWDEPLLKKLDELQKIKSRYEPVTSSGKGTRRLVGGLVMPFASRLVGDTLFGHETAGKRFMLGAVTFLAVKGTFSFIRKYKFRNWLRARKVKEFKEGESHTNENEAPRIPYTFEFVFGT